MLEPKEITIKTQAGEDKVFTISKFPAISGREIIAKYPISAMPKLGDYEVNEETMLKLMGYVSAKTNGGEIQLATAALVDNHVPDWETLAKIEIEMMNYNCSFFQQGKISHFLERIKTSSKELITETLMVSLRSLLQKEKRH